MKKNCLVPNKGLSLSQAQSISNLCNQRAVEISLLLSSVNNFSKTVKVEGRDVVIKKGIKLPSNIVELLKEKAELYACQAFLMENLKAKDEMLKETKTMKVNASSLKKPDVPNYFDNSDKMLDVVTEDFGWEQLTASEYNEYLEAEAYASHIGQFIHKGSILARLRDELTNIPDVEWMELEKDKKSLVTINVHHDSKELLKTHEVLAALHRVFEQRVNYFKSKVKNITTAENARIAKHNADLQNEATKINSDLANNYHTEMKKYELEFDKIRKEFEKTRQERIAEIANMRIQVDGRFQKTINSFLKQLPTEE